MFLKRYEQNRESSRLPSCQSLLHRAVIEGSFVGRKQAKMATFDIHCLRFTLVMDYNFVTGLFILSGEQYSEHETENKTRKDLTPLYQIQERMKGEPVDSPYRAFS